MGLKRRRTVSLACLFLSGRRLAACPFVASGSADLWEGAFVTGRSLCHHLVMAKTVIVKLTDDIDGGDADETIQFALDGKSYEVDLSTDECIQASRRAQALHRERKRHWEWGSCPLVTTQRPASSGHALFPPERRRENTLPDMGRHADGSTDQ